jgi:hypothetical protein
MINIVTGTSARLATQIAAIPVILFTAGLIMASSAAQAQSLDNDQGAIELGGSSPSGSSSGAIQSSQSSGQSGSQQSGQPRVGRKAAEKYLSPTPQGKNDDRREVRDSDATHFLAIHIGTYVSDTAYRWGSPDTQNNVGKWTFGLTYKVGEWINSMDLLMRVDLSSYTLNDGSATKISFLPLITFPDVASRFPLYFGVGAGLGVFAVQFDGKSPLSLDYEVVAGARFFDVFKNTGFFIEAGLKNHFLLLSEGQFNGTFVAIGSVFLF